jgi:hypothetical protein
MGGILDFYHASQPIGAIAHAVWARMAFIGFAMKAAAQKPVAREPACFVFHRARLDYPRYRLAGFPIGSGMIESAYKTLLKPRESGSGMRWMEAGTQAIAALRALHRSRHWQAFWRKDPWAQLVPLSRRIAV